MAAQDFHVELDGAVSGRPGFISISECGVSEPDLSVHGECLSDEGSEFELLSTPANENEFHARNASPVSSRAPSSVTFLHDHDNESSEQEADGNLSCGECLTAQRGWELAATWLADQASAAGGMEGENRAFSEHSIQRDRAHAERRRLRTKTKDYSRSEICPL